MSPTEDRRRTLRTLKQKLTVQIMAELDATPGDMFPAARRVMKDEELSKLGDDLAARKEQLEKQVEHAS